MAARERKLEVMMHVARGKWRSPCSSSARRFEAFA